MAETRKIDQERFFYELLASLRGAHAMNQVDPNTSYLKQHQFGTDRTINDDFPASLPSTGVDSSSRASQRGTPRARPSG